MSSHGSGVIRSSRSLQEFTGTSIGSAETGKKKCNLWADTNTIHRQDLENILKELGEAAPEATTAELEDERLRRIARRNRPQNGYFHGDILEQHQAFAQYQQQPVRNRDIDARAAEVADAAVDNRRRQQEANRDEQAALDQRLRDEAEWRARGLDMQNALFEINGLLDNHEVEDGPGPVEEVIIYDLMRLIDDFLGDEAIREIRREQGGAEDLFERDRGVLRTLEAARGRLPAVEAPLQGQFAFPDELLFANGEYLEYQYHTWFDFRTRLLAYGHSLRARLWARPNAAAQPANPQRPPVDRHVAAVDQNQPAEPDLAGVNANERENDRQGDPYRQLEAAERHFERRAGARARGRQRRNQHRHEEGLREQQVNANLANLLAADAVQRRHLHNRRGENLPPVRAVNNDIARPGAVHEQQALAIVDPAHRERDNGQQDPQQRRDNARRNLNLPDIPPEHEQPARGRATAGRAYEAVQRGYHRLQAMVDNLQEGDNRGGQVQENQNGRAYAQRIPLQEARERPVGPQHQNRARVEGAARAHPLPPRPVQPVPLRDMHAPHQQLPPPPLRAAMAHLLRHANLPRRPVVAIEPINPVVRQNRRDAAAPPRPANQPQPDGMRPEVAAAADARNEALARVPARAARVPQAAAPGSPTRNRAGAGAANGKAAQPHIRNPFPRHGRAAHG